MRTTFRIFAAAAFAALGILTSCQQQGLVPFSDSKELVPVTLTASFVQTKVSYTETTAKNIKPAWDNGDKVIGFDGNNNTYEFTVTDVNATSGAATLTGTAPANCTLHLIYLYGANTGDITSGNLSVSYDGQAGNKTIPAVMLSDGEVAFGSGDFHFSNAGAVIGIDAVKGVPNGSTISKVTVFGDNLAAATIALNDSKLALTATEAVGESISTGTLTGVTVTDEAGTLNNTVFIAVPAGAKVSKVSLDVESKTYVYELRTPEVLIANQYTYVSGKTFKSKRKIVVSFSDASIKPAPESPQPEFVGGEVIKISNGTTAENLTVTVEGGHSFITTTLTGALKAVYPASAAKMNTEIGNGIEGVLVPTVQDGTFANANICMATIEEGATSATFVNQTAVFKLYVPANDDEKGMDYAVKSVAIKSIGENNIADGSKEITVGDGTACVTDADGCCYVALLPGETENKLDVCAGYGLRTLTSEAEICSNNLYSVALPIINGHEYVEIGGRKWATMNVGATTVAGSYETCNGDYFAWGETQSHISSIDWSNLEDIKFTWKEGYADKGYHDSNYKYFTYDSEYGGYTLTKYCSDPECGYRGFTDSKAELDPEDDAATANWGSSWCMPSNADFKDLIKACKDVREWESYENVYPWLYKPGQPINEGGVYYLEGYYFHVAGILFIDKRDLNKRVFFPAAGCFDSEYSSFEGHGYRTRYWSRTLNNPYEAYGTHYLDEEFYLYLRSRASGFSVRPVISSAATEGLSISTMNDGGRL